MFPASVLRRVYIHALIVLVFKGDAPVKIALLLFNRTSGTQLVEGCVYQNLLQFQPKFYEYAIHVPTTRCGVSIKRYYLD